MLHILHQYYTNVNNLIVLSKQSNKIIEKKLNFIYNKINKSQKGINKMSFINENFLLNGKTAQQLYHDYAEKLPLIDYHCHLSPRMIADNHSFDSIGELMLGGDHYKWRLMRSNGIDEKFITGDAPYRDKFRAFASCLPYAIGNPMIHWTQLELKRYFGIDEILNAKTADNIYDRCNEILHSTDMSARALISKSNVEVVCTTDDPADNLEFHKAIAQSDFETKVFPAFRPDRLFAIENEDYIKYIENSGISSYKDIASWLRSRIAFFAENGCVVSDHGFDCIPFGTLEAEKIFYKKLNGDTLTQDEINSYKTALLAICAEEYTKRGWAMQLHIGALRNNNTSMVKKIGADTGFDGINDRCIAETLSKLLDYLSSRDILPKTILYTINPKDNYVLGTMIGNFQTSQIPGKIQFGSGWWFNDQKDGMEAQMKTLGNLGLLGRFVGMLTDSRSFVSYTRHEYFRRILCNMIGDWVDQGLYPNDQAALKTLIEEICYKNAKQYFGF